jgi:hypothetical protein
MLAGGMVVLGVHKIPGARPSRSKSTRGVPPEDSSDEDLEAAMTELKSPSGAPDEDRRRSWHDD